MDKRPRHLRCDRAGRRRSYTEVDASSPKMSNPGRHACPKAAVRTQGMTVIVALDVSDGELEYLEEDLVQMDDAAKIA